MAIKNWTVTVETVKSTAARELYLHSNNHQNHFATEHIIDIWGSAQTSLNIQYQCEKRRLEQTMKRKGGRPPTPAMEYVFTLPKSIRPSEIEWQLILKRIINNLSRSMGLRPTDFNGIVRAVLHQQVQNDTRGAGDHLHVILGKYTKNGEHLKNLQKRGAIHTAKLSFNAAVRAELGISHHDYIAQKTYLKSAKKRVPQWKVRAVREKEVQEQSLALIQRNLNKLFKQCEKWIMAFEQGDKKQVNRQYNRIIKSLELLDQEEVSGYKLARVIDSMTSTIDSKSKKSQLPKLMRKI